MRTESFEIEGIKYTIKRLTVKEREEVLQLARDNKKRESDLLAIQYGLVEPKLTQQELENYDSVHFDIITYKLAQFNAVSNFFEPKPPTSSSQETQKP